VTAATDLLARHPALWQAATRHPFLDALADGSLSVSAFEAWLVQDYRFVADLLAFQARLLARAPRAAQSVIAGGLVGLEAELGWFEGHAAQRGLALNVALHPTTERYRALLEDLDGAPFAAALTGLWAIERAYLDAWLSTMPGAAPFAEFVDHWTSPAFAQYVVDLERAATVALSSASAPGTARAESALVDVATLEHAFWELTWATQPA
jgi:thiaminase